MMDLSRQVCLVSPFASRFRVANGFPRRFKILGLGLLDPCRQSLSFLIVNSQPPFYYAFVSGVLMKIVLFLW